MIINSTLFKSILLSSGEEFNVFTTRCSPNAEIREPEFSLESAISNLGLPTQTINENICKGTSSAGYNKRTGSKFRSSHGKGW